MSRKDILFTILGGFFIANALLAELIGGKIIYVGSESTRVLGLGPFPMSVGVVPWPVVFFTTDLINEYFGRRGVRRLTFLTVGLIAYAFVVVWVTMQIPAARISRIDSDAYDQVLGPGLAIIIGSITAFLVSQLVDVFIFHACRKRTGKAYLWLRATGSTVISQFIDTFVVLYIGVALPGKWDLSTFLHAASTNYSVKLAIAVLLTPLIYLGHLAVERYLGKPLAESLAEEAARESGSGRPPG